MELDDLDIGQDESPGPKRQRTSTACEACRVSKIRCRPSSQPGVCEKPDDKTKPPGPTSTFTIDLEYAAHQESDETFASLLDAHTDMLDRILPSSLPWAVGHLPAEATTFPSTPTSTTSGTLDTNTKPKFNLSSAEALLTAFRRMLPHFPCISLAPDANVSQLAKTNPFALLAILSSASGSRTLQGHSLYDEEFRKVLALKFVASGERSLALLQGILIYCAWYPFHLRPKNNQVRQYIRMAGDLVRELALDQPTEVPQTFLDAERADGIRAYLCYHYLLTALTVSWRTYRAIQEPYTAWTSRCCDLLAESGSLDDQVLSSLVRIGNTVNSASTAVRQDGGETDQQRGLLLLGIEAQLDAICRALPDDVSQAPSVKTAAQYARVYIIAAPTLHPGMITPDFPSTPKLKLCTHLLRQLLLHFASLPDGDYSSFSAPEWSRYVLCIVFSIRLAFAVVGRDWDAQWARHTLQLSELLGQIAADGPSSSSSSFSSSPPPPLPPPAQAKVDVLSAFKVIVRVIRDRYDERVEALERQERELEDAQATRFGCPMLDGTLSDYIPMWDGGFGEGGSGDLLRSAGDEGTQGPVFHDLWATMTMGWTNTPDDMAL